ncbi:MAG: hypothetical protein H6625_09605 [Bdellovibrionaceae bacterium]|nr:hypothetical protein [Pseudobdellovibrionaceae bacterium]
MRIKTKMTLIFSLVAILLFFQNCSAPESLNSSEDSKSSASNLASNYNDINEKVIKPKCLYCHSTFSPGGGLDLTDFDTMMESGTIIPGDPEGSSFYTSLVNGSMPPTTPLDPQNILAIAQWIEDGARDATGQIGNKLPLVNAGNDLYIYEPQNTVTLKGSASDPDGVVVAKVWTQIEGPKTLNIVSPNNLTTEVTGLNVLGHYEFELSVEDDKGDIVTDRVKVSLNPFNNLLPVVSAGLDINIQLPATATSITALAADSDGSIANYLWTQNSGPSIASLSNANTKTVSINGLSLGTYVFKITVTDNKGAESFDLVKVIVDPAAIARTFTDVNNTIFKPKCLNCHQGGNARGGYNMETYAQIMSLVVKNNANESGLFIRCWDDTMPPGNPLSKAEKDKIRDWINTNAPNN